MGIDDRRKLGLLTVDADRELVRAIVKNDLTGVSAWLAQGANVNARDRRGRTPLFEAGYARIDPDITALLLDRGADVRARNDADQTPLHIAAKYGDKARLRRLLDRGAEIEARDVSGHTPLHEAAERPGSERLGFLVSRGADVCARDTDSRTPLHVAAKYGDNAQLRILLDHGAEIDARDVGGETSVYQAALFDRVEATRFLVSRGANLSIPTRDGLTLLGEVRESYALWKDSDPYSPSEQAHWEQFLGMLGGFTNVKVIEARADSVMVRAESHHARYRDAEREAKERGTVIIPTVLLPEQPELGGPIRCPEGLWPHLDEVWWEVVQKSSGLGPVRKLPVDADRELVKAIENNDLNGVSACLARGANPNARAPEGGTSLAEAVSP